MVIFTKYKQVFVQFNGTVTLVYNGRDERVRKPDDARENPVLHSCYVVMAMLECLQRRRRDWPGCVAQYLRRNF